MGEHFTLGVPLGDVKRMNFFFYFFLIRKTVVQAI